MTILAAQAIIRGTDYLLGDRAETARSLSFAETAMPLPVWGLIFTFGGVCVLFGIGKRRARVIATGAGWLVAAYGALGWSLVLNVLDKAQPLSPFVEKLETPSMSLAWLMELSQAFPLDGWRAPTALITAAIIWGAIGWGVMIKAKAWEVSRGTNSRADP